MKYFSETLNKLFDDEQSLTKAEKDYKDAKELATKKAKELKENRSIRAKEVEDAMKIANEANQKAKELLKAFTADYGSFHTTLSTSQSFFDSIFDNFFNLF